jgi:hypothetical protein
MATTATFSNAMKTKFIGPIRDNLSSNKVLLFGLRSRDESAKQKDPQGARDWSGIQSSAEGIDFVGNEFRIPIRISRNQGTGPRAENVPLMAAGNQGYLQITEPLKFYYGTFNITGQLLKASRSNEGAFKQALTAEMQGVTDDLKRHVNIHAYGDGTGSIATISTGVASATQTLSTLIYIQGGETVDIYDVTGVTRRNTNALTVNSYDRATRQVVLSASVTTTTGDIVVRASADSTTGAVNNDLNQALTGLAKIVASTGALHGLNPATAGQSIWKASTVAAAGATVGDNLLRQLTDAIGFESGSDEEIIMITTRGIRNRYANTLTALKRFNDAQSMTLRGGFKALMFDDVPMVVDDHCPKGYVYALNTKALFWSQMSDWEWIDEDGDVLKQVPGYDKYVAYLYKYCNMGTYARNRHGVITGADDDVA